MRKLTIGLCATLLLAACNGNGRSTQTTASVSTDSDVDTTSQLSAPQGESAVVEHVFDGDSLLVSIGGTEVEVRLLGVNAPEGSECHGDAARHTLEQLVASGDVTLVSDGDNSDQYGRLLRYLYVDGLNVNLALLANGDALVLQGDHAANDDFARVSDDAFAASLGMWAPDACGATEAPDTVAIVDYRYNPSGRDEEAMNDEWVAIGNGGSQTVSMSGWVLRDESTQNRFIFPNGFALAPAAEVLVRTGCGQDGPADLYWCANDPVWSNGGDTMILQRQDGTVVARERYAGDF